MLRLSWTSTMVLACGKWRSAKILQDVGVVDGGVAVRDLDVAPAFERREQHEQVGGAVAFVLVIDAGWPSRLHRDWRARLGDELLGGLVQADQRMVGIVRPRVDGQHVFHGRYEGAVGLRRDDPALPAVRLESVFFRTRPIVLSLARSTMPSSTTLLSSRRNVQRARPSGGVEQARGDQLGFLLAVENRSNAAASARCLRLSTASKPSSTSCLRTR